MQVTDVVREQKRAYDDYQSPTYEMMRRVVENVEGAAQMLATAGMTVKEAADAVRRFVLA